jgi:NAD(P)-dependent dehydrogenase (short-subunit alcohol dehydrogenase family)
MNTTSIAAERSAIGSGYYASSKAALDLLTDGLCKELKPLGIRVMVIEPGAFRTHFYDEALKSAPLKVEAYKDSTWKNANAVNKRQQPGDPMKAGELIYRMAYAEKAPFRLLLGADAVKAVITTAEGRIAEANEFKADSESTGF